MSNISRTNQTENLDKSRMSLIKDLDGLKKIYINNKFKFSVEYPKKWNAQDEVYYEATVEHSASPDGGINIYLEDKKDEKIYVYGQDGHINFENHDFQRESFTTNNGLNGRLFSKEMDGKKVIYLILDEGFHGAYINIRSETFNQNKEQIMDVLKSIKILN